MNTRLTHRPHRPTVRPSRPALFALILTGNALAPRLCHGDTVAIDARRKPQPGDAVLVHFDGNPSRQGVMLLNADMDLTDMRGAFVPRGCYTIAGTVIGSEPARKV